ncbi:unnamed protein product [marine sediment metagenome]|uniref:Glycosyltransferase 2-like domain-containing protein n=1 Tax=marine sediment metagenome TaxID=412755 RepID=X1M3Q3_9ZZZZ
MDHSPNLISVVTPVYGCEESLPELYERVELAIQKIKTDFELIMVVDGSPDNSWNVIMKMAGKDNRVKGILFSRNFGQHKAIAAGLERANGEWIVVLDCDLQDQPEEIPKLYNKAIEGYDLVLGRRQQTFPQDLLL